MGLTVYVASIILAASSESPASSGSTVPNNKFALNPPETPANAAAIPARGCRPTERNIIPANGISNTYPTSLAIFDRTPEKTIINVRRCFGADKTSRRMAAPINPLLSAIPSDAWRQVQFQVGQSS